MEPGNKLPTMLQQHFWVGLWFCCCCLFVNTEVSIQRSKLQASCSAMKRTSSFMEFHSQNKPLVFRSSLSLGMQTTCQIHLYKIITVPNESRRRSFRCFEYLRGNPIAQMLGLLSLLTLLLYLVQPKYVNSHEKYDKALFFCLGLVCAFCGGRVWVVFLFCFFGCTSVGLWYSFFSVCLLGLFSCVFF